jgi:hypothetical protein
MLAVQLCEKMKKDMESQFPMWNQDKTEINKMWISHWLKVDCVSCKLNQDVA